MFLIYLTNLKISPNQEILKVVKELRGKSFNILKAAAILGLIILRFLIGKSFIANNLNPGLRTGSSRFVSTVNS